MSGSIFSVEDFSSALREKSEKFRKHSKKNERPFFLIECHLHTRLLSHTYVQQQFKSHPQSLLFVRVTIRITMKDKPTYLPSQADMQSMSVIFCPSLPSRQLATLLFIISNPNPLSQSFPTLPLFSSPSPAQVSSYFVGEGVSPTYEKWTSKN